MVSAADNVLILRPRTFARYNLLMRLTFTSVVLALMPVFVLSFSAAVIAQNAPASQAKTVTVPITFDQGRIVIDVDLPLPDGSTERLRAWVDAANPNLCMTQRVTSLLKLGLSCRDQLCSATPTSPATSLEVVIAGMKISLAQVRKEEETREIKVPAGRSAIGPGMSAEINIPSTVLRNYDVLINFPDRELTIGAPGSLKFNGVKSKMLVNASNGLIEIPSRIDNKNYNLGLGLGSSTSFLSEELFDKLSRAHPNWPHMTGAVGPFNTGELADEPKLKLMRVDRVQYGPLFLTDVAVAGLPADLSPNLSNGHGPDRSPERNPAPNNDGPTLSKAHAGIGDAGLLASEALMNYRVGLDYAHSTVYFDIGRTVNLPDFDVVGLILRPEDDNRFTIVAVADFDGQPSVADVHAGDHLIAIDDNPVAEFTVGQVWSLLEGSPGQERKLTVEHAGKQFSIVARAQHFLGGAPDNQEDDKGKSKRN